MLSGRARLDFGRHTAAKLEDAMAIGGSFAFTKVLMGYFCRLPQEYTRHEGHPVILAEQSFVTFWHTGHMG